MPPTLLYDLGTRGVYEPYFQGTDGTEYVTEFAVPRQRTMRPMLIDAHFDAWSRVRRTLCALQGTAA
jgi:hypothetical protein